ncbi:SUF system NifU family Fe-S cluster assembly protein [Candidatus Dojkabacteria bacterium]|nr:SUF system NifU family Fe-S cluster assembly protein [Candidatus Dojkabacteria bacterium]
MSNQMYRQQMLDHYKNPRNEGEMDNPTHTSELENISCGDEIKVYLRVKDDKLSDIKFQGKGCAICLASASMTFEDIKGKTLDYISKLDISNVEKLIGIELSPSRKKCAHLGLLTVQNAINNK